MSKFLNKYVIGIVIFYAVWLFCLPFMLSEATVFVCNKISNETDYKIEILNPEFKLSVLPNVKIKFDKLNIATKEHDFSANITEFNLCIRLLPLLSKRLHINDLYIDKFELSSTMNGKSHFDKNLLSKIDTRLIACNNFKVNSFDIKLFMDKSSVPMIYKGNGLEFSETYKNFKFVLDSKLYVANKVSDINFNLFLPKNNDIKKTVFDINISDVTLSEYGSYFKDFLPQDLISLKGTINIKADKNELVAIIQKCAINNKDEAKSLIFPDILKINAKFNINKNVIKIKTADISSDTVHVNLSGMLSNYRTSKPEMDFNIKINKSRLEDISKMAPPVVIESFNVYKLKQHKFYADIVGNIVFKGNIIEPDIFGYTTITNGILVKPLKDTPEGATIKLNFTGRHVSYDAVVPAKTTEKVMVKGTAEIYDTFYANTRVSSTQNVDLELTETVLLPLHEILNFDLGPLPILDVHGLGNIDIKIKGTRKDPHILGAFNFRDTSAKFNDMPDLVIENASGTMPFDDAEVRFVTNTGKVNGQDFSIKGKSTLSGKFDFEVNTKDQPTSKMYYALKTSKMNSEISNILPDIKISEGLLNLKLKIYGNVKNIEDMEFGKNLFVKSYVELKNTCCKIDRVEIKKANGKIELDEKNNLQTNITAFIDNYPMFVKIKTNKQNADVNLKIPRINPNFLIQDSIIKNAQLLPEISLIAEYKGNMQKFDDKKLSAEIKVLKPVPTSDIQINTGNIAVKNGNISVTNLNVSVGKLPNNIKTNLVIKNAFDKKRNVNGNVYLKMPDLKLINEIYAYEFLPQNIKSYLKDFEFNKGSLNTDFKIINNKLFANIDLGNTEITYLPLDLPVKVMNGNLVFKNETAYLQRVNLIADTMPVLLDGKVIDIFDKQKFNIYINSKPQQEFIDKYFNTKQIYPAKIKGDIVSFVRIKGIKDVFDINCDIKLNKEASFYYYGATIGDIENTIKMSLQAQNINQTEWKIKEFSYDKLIDSQRGKQTVHNMLKAYGAISVQQKNLFFKDFHIKTTNPTDARIFNIIFRRPDIKQGQFTSDIKVCGNLQNPKIIGNFDIFETEIPFFDTVMKTISLDFRDKTIEISSKGDVIGNDVVFRGVMKNNLTPPYYIKEANVYLKNLNINNIIEKMKSIQAESVANKNSIETIGINSVIYDNVEVKADNIELRNIKATNVEAVATMNNNGEFEIPDFKFNIANGNITGKYYQNIVNDKIRLSMQAEDIDANDITKAVFDIDNQIYGDLRGSINLSCTGKNYKNCLRTLEGESVFNVKNGKMPKLGSLEYLLKAGNLVKGGITGVSINGIIDIITPLKTGEFSDIYGVIAMKDGIANQIEITTQGKDLSLFIAGSYNLSTSHATMEVFGLLSRKMSTMFGALGNLSINTLFNVIPGIDLSQNGAILSKINRIPGIELSNKAVRKFIAEINGDINGDNYVSSFMWIN